MNTTYCFVAFGFLLFCFYMLRHAMRNYHSAKQSDNWLSTRGKITDMRLWGRRKVDGEMVDCENVSVKFQYEVSGQQYSGVRVAFYTLHYPETINFAKCYPVGSEIPVFYNPLNIADSVLVPGLHPHKPSSEIWLAGIGVVIASAILIGLALGEIS